MVLVYAYLILYTIFSVAFVLAFVGRWFLGKKDSFEGKVPSVRFAALIAARNEEEVVADVVGSLAAQDYPKELYDVYVLVNNTTDRTAEVAESAGAHVILCPPSVRSKGQALRHAFHLFEEDGEGYDAYCIFDADNLVDPEFLQKMNDCYLSGHHLAQGYRDIRNPNVNGHTFFMVLFFGLVNHFYNETHRRLGQSAGLNGTGLMIGADVLRQTGYDPKTLVEDMEYTAVCALHDIPIAYVSEAVVLDEQPEELVYSLRQRRRWSAGQFQCLHLYGGALLKKKTFQSLDAFLYLFGAYHMSVGFLLMLLCSALSVLLSSLPPLLLLLECLLGYLLYLAYCSLVYLTKARDLSTTVHKPGTVKLLLIEPLYFIAWNFVILSALIRPPREHESIPHKGGGIG